MQLNSMQANLAAKPALNATANTTFGFEGFQDFATQLGSFELFNGVDGDGTVRDSLENLGTLVVGGGLGALVKHLLGRGQTNALKADNEALRQENELLTEELDEAVGPEEPTFEATA